MLKVIAVLALLPISVLAQSAEDYRGYFAQRDREERAAECARIEQESYSYAYQYIAKQARKYGAKIVGGLTKADDSPCRGVIPFYATLDNQMRCYYTPYIRQATDSFVTCK